MITKSNKISCILLLLIYLLASMYKVNLTTSSSYFNPKDETGLFWTETALQYKYASIIAEGKRIPEKDLNIQYPEGIDVFKDLTINMEFISGVIYRFIKMFGLAVPFHFFAAYFVSFFSSLSIFPLYFISRYLWRSSLSAFIVILFYVVMPASYMRSIVSFLTEDFTLPFLFTGIVSFAVSLEKQKVSWFSWISGISFGFALTSWHLSQFVFTLLIFYCSGIYFFHPEKKELLFRNLSILIIFAILAGIISPMLRSKGFLTSFPMILSAGILLSHTIGEFFKWNPLQRFALLFSFTGLFFLLPFYWMHKSYQEYSHVYELIFYKIRFLGEKPVNPNLMSYNAKALWTSSFVTPMFQETITYFSSLLLITPFPLFQSIRDFFKKKLSIPEECMLYFLIVFFILYLMIIRLQVFFIFFLSIFAGKLLAKFPSTIKREMKFQQNDVNSLIPPIAIVIILAFCIGGEIYKNSRLRFYLFRPNGDKDVISWVKRNTASKDVILSSYEFGPSIYAYADRPVNLHSKWETHGIREKIRQFEEGLFKNEAAFFNLCLSWKTDYYIYQIPVVLDTSQDSTRYIAGLSNIPRDSAAYLFHFAPEELKHFSLVYQNSYYRIFRILKFKAKEITADDIKLSYLPVYDASLFDQEKKGNALDDSHIPEIFSLLEDPRFRYSNANRLYKDGRYQDALLEYQDAAFKYPVFPEAYVGIGNSLLKTGNKKESYEMYKKAINLNSGISSDLFDVHDSDIARELAKLFVQSGLTDQGLVWLEKTLEINPDDAEARSNLGGIYLIRNKFDRAVKEFEETIQRNPQYSPPYKNIGILYQKTGRHDKAVFYLKKYITLFPQDQEINSIRQYIAGMEGIE